MVYGGGPYKQRIEDRVRELQGPQTRSCARQQTERETQEQLIERLRRMYMENLHHFVSHTQRDEQGRIVTISANLLENIPFMDQVLAFLTDVFYICRDRQPYKIVIQFGLLLYKLDTDEYRIWYINKHVNADHRYGMADITTMPNTWRIDNYVDEQRVMNDMLHTNFWRIINAEFHAYNYIVVRPTNIRATIFPTNIYDNMDNQHLGRRRLLRDRGTDSDDEGNDDELIEEGYILDHDEDGDSVERIHQNPFVLDNVAVEDDNNTNTIASLSRSDDILVNNSGRPNELEKINMFVTGKCRGRNPQLVSLRHMLRGVELKKLCFFGQICRWKTIHQFDGGGVLSEAEFRHKVIEEYYATYR